MTVLISLFFIVITLPVMIPLLLAAWPLVLFLALLVWAAGKLIKDFLDIFLI